jgi:hypothetical protein
MTHEWGGVGVARKRGCDSNTNTYAMAALFFSPDSDMITLLEKGEEKKEISVHFLWGRWGGGRRGLHVTLAMGGTIMFSFLHFFAGKIKNPFLANRIK